MVDNYIKIVKGQRYYARYTDDSYVIHESKEVLEELLDEVISVAASIGITVNTRKTRICKLSDFWRFLQIQYSLTETGRIVQKINPKRLTTMRRKMKKLVHILPPQEFDKWYLAWFKNHYKIMSEQQRENLDGLFKRLKEERADVLDQTGKRQHPEQPRTEREQLYLGNRSRRQYLRGWLGYGETHTDMKLVANRVDGGKSWFILDEKTEQEKTAERLAATLAANATSITDIQMALAELSILIAGGMA